MGAGNFPTWFSCSICFLRFFSTSFCGNQFKRCFIFSDVVFCTCLLIHFFRKQEKKGISFLPKPSFNNTINQLSISVPQLKSNVNILKWRCVVPHLIALLESVAVSLVFCQLQNRTILYIRYYKTISNPVLNTPGSSSSYLLQRLAPEAYCQPWALKFFENARIQVTRTAC